MVKEERSHRTRLAAGKKRRIARRTKRRFPHQAVARRPSKAQFCNGFELNRLNTKTSPEATRPNCLKLIEVYAMPTHRSVRSDLLVPQPSVAAYRPSSSAA